LYNANINKIEEEIEQHKSIIDEHETTLKKLKAENIKV